MSAPNYEGPPAAEPEGETVDVEVSE